MSNGMRGRAAGAVVAAALLAALVWWRWPVADARPPRAAVAINTAAMPPQRPHPLRGESTRPGFDQPPPADPQAARCADDRQRQFQARLDQVQVPRTPDESIEHAMLVVLTAIQAPVPDFGAAGREYRAARLRWPQDLELAWLSLQACSEHSGCDRQAEWRHLETLDPDNAATWMYAMQIAKDARDEAAYDIALHRAAIAKFYDPRREVTFLHARLMLAALPPPETCLDTKVLADFEASFGRPAVAEDWADAQAMGLELAVAMPFVVLGQCSEKSKPLPATQRQDCIGLLSKVAGGDTVVEREVALARLIPLVGNGPGGAQLRERYRELRWLRTRPRRLQFPQGYAARLHAEGEVATLRAGAIDDGQWPPPSNWLPEDARGRALIQGGRLPP